MIIAFLLNFFTLFLAVKKHPLWAVAGLLVVGGIQFTHGFKGVLHLDSLTFMTEGILCSLVLLLCFFSKCGAGAFYFWGIIPSLLFIIVALSVPTFYEMLRNEIISSWKAQTAILTKISLYKETGTADGFVGWLIRLFPTYWLLSSVFRIFVVRKVLFLTVRETGNDLPQTPFLSLRINELFLWVIVAGLLLEIFGPLSLRVAGHNLLLFSAALYLFQGVAIAHSFFKTYRVSFLYILFFYILVLFTQIPLAIIAFIGFVDTWLEFRNRLINKPIQT
ncbi:MAG: YybS family protein [Syntrophales bacterium LBB04]|nr:YybS family protein [Syntrophales bacterium LBB04]